MLADNDAVPYDERTLDESVLKAFRAAYPKITDS